jgi:hypothetical protein
VAAGAVLAVTQRAGRPPGTGARPGYLVARASIARTAEAAAAPTAGCSVKRRSVAAAR